MRFPTKTPLLLAAAIGCHGAPDPTAEWFTPATVVSSETNNGATPMLTVASNGNRVLSWVSDSGGGGMGVLDFVVTSPAGELLARSRLRDSLGGIEPHGEGPPQLTVAEDGAIYALYTVGKEMPDSRFPLSALRFSRSEDGGRNWSAPISVNEGAEFGSHNFHAIIAGKDQTIHATWLSSAPLGTSGADHQHDAAGHGGSAVWLRTSHDGGRTWAPSRPIHAEPTCPCCRTGLAIDSQGALYVSFRKVFEGDVRDIVVMRSDDGGNTWNSPVRPREDGWNYPGCPHAGPSMRVDGDGTIHIAWWTGKTGEAGVWYGRSTDGGRSFSPLPISVGERSAPSHVQVILANRGPVVIWDDGLGDIPAIQLRASNDGGHSFGTAVTLSDRYSAATFPVGAVVGDSLMIAWSQVGSEEHRRVQAARPDMSDPRASVKLPRVGQSEIWLRIAALEGLVDTP